MKVERVILEPVDEQVIVGVGRVGGVKAVERPGWMIEPEERVAQSEGEGGVLRLAEKGEKVVLYLHAGCVSDSWFCSMENVSTFNGC